MDSRERAGCRLAIGPILLVVVAVLAVVFSTSEARADVPEIVERYAQRLGVSVAEAQRRLAIQTTVQELRPVLEQQFPANYAGLRLEHEPRFEARLFWKGGNPPTDVLGDLDVVVERVDDSITELTRRAADLAADSTGDPVAIDVEGNKVTEPDFAITPYADEMGSSPFMDNTHYCTAGFVVRSTSSGRLGWATSGHCPSSGSIRHPLRSPHHSVVVSGTGWLGGRHDLRGLFPRSTSGLNFTNSYRAVGRSRSAITATTRAGVGDWVCQYGRTTGCGFVIVTSYSYVPVGETYQLRDFVVAGDCREVSRPGDSGAAVVSGSSGRALVGILSGGGSQPAASCGSGRLYIFSYGKVEAFAAVGLAPVTAAPPKCRGLAVTHVGTEGNDTLRGSSGRDVMHGLGGDDVIHGFGGDDIICGGGGRDTISGGNGNDTIEG